MSETPFTMSKPDSAEAGSGFLIRGEAACHSAESRYFLRGDVGPLTTFCARRAVRKDKPGPFYLHPVELF